MQHVDIFLTKYTTQIKLFVSAILFKTFILLLIALWINNSGVFLDNSLADFPVFGGDSFEYALNAENIIYNTMMSTSKQAPFFPESFRTPGYPVFIALVELFTTRSIYSVMFAQIILASLSVVLLYQIGYTLFDKRSALLAAVLLAIEPVATFHSLIILSDSLFVFIFLLSIYLMIECIMQSERKMTLWIFTAGFLLGYAILVRSIAQFFFLPAMIFLYLWLHHKNFSKTRIFSNLSIFFIAILLILTPWSLRNYAIFHNFKISSVGDVGLLSYNTSLFVAYKNNITYAEANSALEKEVMNTTDNLYFRSLINDKRFQVVSHKYLDGHWLEYAKFHLIKTIPFFVTDGIRDLLVQLRLMSIQHQTNNFSNMIIHGNWQGLQKAITTLTVDTIILIISACFWLLIMVFIALSLYKYTQRYNTLLPVLFFAFIIFYFAILTGPVSNARYRLPAEPFMFLLAALGFFVLYDFLIFKFKQQR